jgi:membrane associated rhomboid family serine protease
MIPIRDDAPRYTTPYVNNFLIALNTVVFLLMWIGFPAPAQQVVNVFGFEPVRVTALLRGADAIQIQGAIVPVNATSAFLPVFTSMFMHGGWLHLIFNMWALWIFGDNIEDYIGHFRYLVFYLLAGVAGTALHTLMNATSAVPSVGASGAIAGVMGAYMMLYPTASVTTLVPFFFIFFIRLPAWLVLGYWFVGQFLSGAAMSIAYTRQTSGGGIAFWAHVGGFVAGIVLIKVFPARVRRAIRFSGW